MLDISTKYFILSFPPKLKLSKNFNFICCLESFKASTIMRKEIKLIDSVNYTILKTVFSIKEQNSRFGAIRALLFSKYEVGIISHRLGQIKHLAKFQDVWKSYKLSVPELKHQRQTCENIKCIIRMVLTFNSTCNIGIT